MYGIVNKAIQGLVTENFGEDKWDDILMESDVDHDTFLSHEAYDDAITYQLAGAASKVLGLGLDQVLFAFGEYWVLNTAQKHYGDILKSGGDHFVSFMEHLPDFHSRVMMVYPNITPPEFKVEVKGDNELDLHYISSRPGLKDFVSGLISGIGKYFDVETSSKLIASRDEGHEHEIFKVNWK